MSAEGSIRGAARASGIKDVTQQALRSVELAFAVLESRYRERLVVDAQLTRQLVSFQANKERASYRWYKYKEGFSAALVEHFLLRFGLTKGILLDPFAGSGTALFAGSAHGLDTVGVELLPIGVAIIDARKQLERNATASDLKKLVESAKTHPWKAVKARVPLHELRITKDAYSEATRAGIEQYLAWSQTQPPLLKEVYVFALLCVLEQVSFTRKDGQYLRWDHRSGRRRGKKPFDKGIIHPFDEAVATKLTQISHDIGNNYSSDLFSTTGRTSPGDVTLHAASCLDLLPEMPSAAFDVIITSPPYCNRYDYTRTYALELALLGASETGISELRQSMLSCTVENRSKDLVAINGDWRKAVSAADQQEALRAALDYLEGARARDELNNNGIPRMVRGYFYEMACIIQECARVLKGGAKLVMANDNVRYAGASIPVDLILSDIAAKLGFEIESILVLPSGKGNSSQQMGTHGRDALRKCVYIWTRKEHADP